MTFLEELQSLDEPTKTKVLIVSTIVIMIVVVYFWLAYFNNIVSSAGGQAVADSTSAEAAAGGQDQSSQSPSFWSEIGNGTAIVGQAIGGGLQWVEQAFESPKNYIIKPSSE
jgi:hypothetical protein